MKFKTSISTVFHCDLERAFKSPMLCDITKVHTGWSIFMPKVTHCVDDENWGKTYGSRRVFMAKSLTFKGGEALFDKVLERKENDRWTIEVTDVKTFSMGIHTFIGEWITVPIDEYKTQIIYRYTLCGKGVFLAPFQWFMTKVIWRHYMGRVLKNIERLTQERAPYLFE